MCGKFLCYARAVDTTMLYALNDYLATQITKGTEKTMEALTTHILNYCVCNELQAILVHHAIPPMRTSIITPQNSK